MGNCKSTHFVVRKDNKGTAPGTLDDDGKEFGVDGTERRIPGALANADIVVALFPFEGLAVNMTKFGAPHYPERHLRKIDASEQRERAGRADAQINIT